IAIEVPPRHRIRVRACGVVLSCLEAAVAIAKQDTHNAARFKVGYGKIEMAVAVEISGGQGSNVTETVSLGWLERAVAVAHQDGNATVGIVVSSRTPVGHDEVRDPITVKVPYH